jgi:hypothetical protein
MSKETITAFKGFDENWQCRGFQYEIGKTYKHDGEVGACSSGFHSCLNPFDVLNYYDVTSKFAIVELNGETSTHNSDSKIASAEITIKAELKLPDFVSSCINYLKDICNNGAASGDNSQLAASGDYSQLAASGDNSQLVVSGDYSQLAASGDYSQLAASGDNSQLVVSGDYSVVVSSGIGSKAKCGENGSIALTRWVESEKRYRISVAYEGEDIKADTWYQLDADGNFVECQ